MQHASTPINYSTLNGVTNCILLVYILLFDGLNANERVAHDDVWWTYAFDETRLPWNLSLVIHPNWRPWLSAVHRWQRHSEFRYRTIHNRIYRRHLVFPGLSDRFWGSHRCNSICCGMDMDNSQSKNTICINDVARRCDIRNVNKKTFSINKWIYSRPAWRPTANGWFIKSIYYTNAFEVNEWMSQHTLCLCLCARPSVSRTFENPI